METAKNVAAYAVVCVVGAIPAVALGLMLVTQWAIKASFERFYTRFLED